MKKFTHLDDAGRVKMVDVGHKPAQTRIAVAEGRPIHVNDVHVDPRYVEAVPGSNAELVVPLRRKGRVVLSSTTAGQERNFSVFANLRNVNDPTDDVEIAGPNTPPVAQFRQRAEFGSLWTFGLKGTF